MTGGHVKFYDDGTSATGPDGAETYKVSQVTVKRGNKLLKQVLTKERQGRSFADICASRIQRIAA